MTEIALPQTAAFEQVNVPLKAYSETDNIQISYRDTSGTNAGVKQVTASKLQFDITQGFNEQILSGSVRFVVGNDVMIDRNGILYRNVDPATGSGTSSGSVQYATGLVELNSWTPGADNTLVLQSLTTTTDQAPINHVSFRVPIIPVRPSSLTVVASPLTGGQITLTANSAGVMTASNAHGKVNYETGFVDIYYYTKTLITIDNRPDIEAEDWYNVELEYTDSGNTYINVPVWIAPETLKYSCVVYSYLPLDAETLGLDPVRLPSDGRVPFIRKGNVIVLHDTKTTAWPDPEPDAVLSVGRTNISYAKVYDSEGTALDLSMYTVDMAAGEVTLASSYELGTLILPLSVEHRIEDIAVATDVQINGLVQLNRPITHNYVAGDAMVSSALIIGDIQARAYNLFSQQTWTAEWSNQIIGNSTTSQYNEAVYPLAVTNKGAIKERWALIFTSTTDFRVVGEESGQIGTGSINAACAPVNPVTSAPYFTIAAEGWGGGWSAGNVLRFNTDPASFPVWVARTIQQGEATADEDGFQIQIRCDVDK